VRCPQPVGAPAGPPGAGAWRPPLPAPKLERILASTDVPQPGVLAGLLARTPGGARGLRGASVGSRPSTSQRHACSPPAMHHSPPAMHHIEHYTTDMSRGWSGQTSSTGSICSLGRRPRGRAARTRARACQACHDAAGFAGPAGGRTLSRRAGGAPQMAGSNDSVDSRCLSSLRSAIQRAKLRGGAPPPMHAKKAMR